MPRIKVKSDDSETKAKIINAKKQVIVAAFYS